MYVYSVKFYLVYTFFCAINMAMSTTKRIDKELFEACLNLDISHVKDIMDKGANPSTLLCRAEAATSTIHLVCGVL